MMQSVSGKTAIITGGGSGVGQAIAKHLVMERCNVVIASRRMELLEKTTAELNALNGGKAISVQCDIRNKSDVVAVVQKSRAEFGTIDFLVNNSGLGIRPTILDCSEEEWDLVIATNLKGTFLMSQAVLPAMIDQKSGFILNIASQAAKRGYPNTGPYCASKFGILGFADALQQEVWEHNIVVHSICPSLIQKVSPATEAERLPNKLHVDDVANLVLFLFKQPSYIKFDDIGLYVKPKAFTPGNV